MKTTNISNMCPVCGSEKIWGESEQYDDYIDYPWTCACGAKGFDHSNIVFEETEYDVPSSDQLMAFFENKYGENWERGSLTEKEDRAWLEALYEWYEKEVPMYPVYYSFNEGEEWYRKPFKIIGRCTVDEGYDLEQLPMWV